MEITRKQWNDLVVETERLHGVKVGTVAEAVGHILCKLNVTVEPEPILPNVPHGKWWHDPNNEGHIWCAGSIIALKIKSQATGKVMAGAKELAELNAKHRQWKIDAGLYVAKTEKAIYDHMRDKMGADMDESEEVARDE